MTLRNLITTYRSLFRKHFRLNKDLELFEASETELGEQAVA